MRLQLALNVNDLEQSVAYYSKLFGAEPHKRRPGYANFAIAEPPLKLVLFENPGAGERLNHLGVEVDDSDELAAAERRLAEAGLIDRIENDTTCCHAKQDKVWSAEPDGLAFEWYRITDDEPEAVKETLGGCCGATPTQSVCCAEEQEARP